MIALAHLAEGTRLALILFAVMSILTIYRGPAADEQWERMKNRSWGLISAAVLVYSPAHAAWLAGHPLPKIASTFCDTVACTLSSLGFICLLAARGLRRGLSNARVRNGMIVNIVILIAVVGTAWLGQ